MEKKTSRHLLSGLIIAAVLIALNLLNMFTGLKEIAWFAFVPSIVLAALSLVNVLHYARENGATSFGNYFAYGFKSIAATTCIMFLYTWLSINYFFPAIKEKAFTETREYVSKQPNILPGNIDTETAKAMKAYMPTTLSLVIMTTLVVGAVGAAMGAVLSPKPNHQ